MGIAAAHILAGPIVRRVERDLVAVWIALAKPAAVKLDVFRGVGPRSTLGAPIAAVTHPVATGRRGIPPDQHTLAFGANLHVAMALFEPEAPASLEWGTVYSYDLRLTADDDGSEVGLLELGLLGNEPVTNRLGVAQPHLALGYTVGFLPSFATPASRPLELKIAHGSCRWASGEGKDGMAIVDELIGASLANATQRPQMLWLTGDQIYADAVAPELGRICIELGSWLLGDHLVNEHLKVDVLDDTVSPELPATHEYKLDLEHFPPGRRGHLVASAGFTSVKQDSHLIGFGEYAATYINGWSNVTWPALEPMLQARFADVQAFVADHQELRADLKKASERRKLPAEDHEELRDFWSAWHLVPIELRSLHGHLTESDRWDEWGESNVSSGGSPWSKFWLDASGDTGASHRYRQYAEPPHVHVSASITINTPDRLLARALTPPWWAGKKAFWVTLDDEGGVLEDEVRDRLHQMKHFHADLPQVRRALANVATYMVFDDHEVCDDWNITRGWVKKVRSSALGRDLLRNGMAAFLVFQAWGNNPRAYADPNTVEHKALVDIAHLFVDEAGERLVKGPVPARATALEHRFDIQNLDTPPPAADERMPWHFRYDGAAFEILALDTRTRRSYEPDADPTIGQPFTLEANAALLTDEALREQIPEEPPTGNELSVVVAAVPVLGYPPVESLVQPVLNIYDIAKQPDNGRFARLKAPDRLGRVNYDPEPWGYVPRLHAALLDRLSSRSRVVFLSGDVHYSATLEMAYWKRRQPTELETTRFVQLTGSSFRARQPIAQPEHFSIDLLQIISRELSRQHELLGWHLGPTGTAEGATPLAEPADGHFNDRTRYLMTIDPILVSPAGLPAGTQVIRDFEWASRLNLVIDPRPDEERLEGLTPPPLRPTQADDVTTMVQSAADRVVWHVENAPDRTWMWWSNATIVDFLDTPPRVRHSIYTFDLATPMPGARPYLIATVGLDVNPTEQPPRVP